MDGSMGTLTSYGLVNIGCVNFLESTCAQLLEYAFQYPFSLVPVLLY